MNHENTNWQQSVTGVVIREGKVLLARHTYGPGKGRLIVPGGYVEQGETPQDAVRREIWEETGVRAEPEDVIAIRFNRKDWYVAFSAYYLDGYGGGPGERRRAGSDQKTYFVRPQRPKRTDTDSFSEQRAPGALFSVRHLSGSEERTVNIGKTGEYPARPDQKMVLYLDFPA